MSSSHCTTFLPQNSKIAIAAAIQYCRIYQCFFCNMTTSNKNENVDIDLTNKSNNNGDNGSGKEKRRRKQRLDGGGGNNSGGGSGSGSGGGKSTSRFHLENPTRGQNASKKTSSQKNPRGGQQSTSPNRSFVTPTTN